MSCSGNWNTSTTCRWLLRSETGWAVPVKDAWDEVPAWRYSEDLRKAGEERGE